MSEYIEREALKEMFLSNNKPLETAICSVIDAVPAADVAPVVHGEWVEAKVGGMSLYPDGQKMCSVCGQIMPSRWQTMPPFCFGCGAKMNAESEESK